jgi:hypothetical protein
MEVFDERLEIFLELDFALLFFILVGHHDGGQIG